jgi:hypothetical protein
MNRRKIVEVVLTIAVLGAVGAWSYSSGSSSPSSAVSFSTSTNPDPGIGPPPSAKLPAGATTSVATTVPAPTTTVVANPQAYANALFGYWTRRDHASATKVASLAVVRRLFSARPWVQSDGWVGQGCKSTAGSLYCTWVSPARHFVFQVQSAAGGLPLQVISLRITHP